MPPLQNGSPTVATKHAERAHTNTLTREKTRAVLASPCTPSRPRPRVVVCGGRRSVAFCRRRRFKSYCIYIQTVATGQQNYKHAKHHCAAAAEKERILRPRRHTSTTPDPDAGWTDDDGHATFVRLFPRRSPRRVSREDKGRATTKDRYSAPETTRRCCRWRTTHER